MLYEHYIDYTNEASNDMTFLESIEHMRRCHTDSVERLTDQDLYCTEDANCNFSPNVPLCEANNSNDCDLDLLVNPQTGLPVYDLSGVYSENASHEFDTSPSASVPDTTPDFFFTPKMTEPAPEQPYTLLLDIKEERSQPEHIKLIGLNNFSVGQCSSANSMINQTSSNNKVVVIQLSAPTQKNLGAGKKLDALRHSQGLLEPKHDKPPFSYSCLITMALKNSETGFLPVSEIYNYIVEKFPYFKTAPDGWKNSIRHNLSLNKCFQKLETPALNGSTRKACLWGLNRSKITRLNEEIAKWVKKNSSGSAADIINEAFSNENSFKFDEMMNEPEEAQNENYFTINTDVSSIPVTTFVNSNFFQNVVPKGESNDHKMWKFIKVDLPSYPKENATSCFKVMQSNNVVKDEIQFIRISSDELSDQQLSPGDPLFSSSVNQAEIWDDMADSFELQPGIAYRLITPTNSTLNLKSIPANV